jgi:hypothetical protein
MKENNPFEKFRRSWLDNPAKRAFYRNRWDLVDALFSELDCLLEKQAKKAEKAEDDFIRKGYKDGMAYSTAEIEIGKAIAFRLVQGERVKKQQATSDPNDLLQATKHERGRVRKGLNDRSADNCARSPTKKQKERIRISYCQDCGMKLHDCICKMQ